MTLLQDALYDTSNAHTYTNTTLPYEDHPTLLYNSHHWSLLPPHQVFSHRHNHEPSSQLMDQNLCLYLGKERKKKACCK